MNYEGPDTEEVGPICVSTLAGCILAAEASGAVGVITTGVDQGRLGIDGWLTLGNADKSEGSSAFI